jgi:hypothetical protein
MKTCLLIAGHWQIENITAKGLRPWRSYANLRKSTGASGERDWVWNDLLPLLRDKLIASGVQVFITDAIYHEETYSRDYDLALALHFDAGGTDSRCIISKPNPSQNPPYLYPEALAKADEFISHWLAVYPQMTGIASRQDRITEGMTDYYAWDYLKEGTPSVIIEHGNNTCPQDSEKMHNHTELIAEADVAAVRRFLLPEPVVEDNRYWIYHRGQVLEGQVYAENPKDLLTELENRLKENDRLLADKTAELEQLRREIEKQDQHEKSLIEERNLARRERDDLALTLQLQKEGQERALQGLRNEIEELSIENAKLTEKVKRDFTYRKLVGNWFIGRWKKELPAKEVKK